MKVGLFIPCYIDQFYPKAGIATLELLESLGCEVVYPLEQTCCGQPMANAGFARITESCNAHFADQFSSVDYIVSPSGSCVLHVKEHNADVAPERLFELCEFLTDVLHVQSLNASFPHRVGLHQGCHGQRGLHLSSMSEKVEKPFSKPLSLLNMVKDLTIADLQRNDECCGFGGTFSVFEEAVSVKMGKDRVADHEAQNVAFITSPDMSCLMHLEGILKRKNSPVKVIHIAEILRGV
jgi:L-lactate dehydrogenase complex protein LldE